MVKTVYLRVKESVLNRLNSGAIRTHSVTPAKTKRLPSSNSVFHPYNPVARAMSTDDHPIASLTSICVFLTLYWSGLEKN